jgi:hypothetical protein
VTARHGVVTAALVPAYRERAPEDVDSKDLRGQGRR